MLKVFFFTFTILFFISCGPRAYVDVKSKDYATLQLIPDSKMGVFSDTFYTIIQEYSTDCANMKELGYLTTKSDQESKIIKIPAEKLLLLKAGYPGFLAFGSPQIPDIDFVLKPKKNMHYIVRYVHDSLKRNVPGDFYVYMQDGERTLDIPRDRLRNFNARECK